MQVQVNRDNHLYMGYIGEHHNHSVTTLQTSPKSAILGQTVAEN